MMSRQNVLWWKNEGRCLNGANHRMVSPVLYRNICIPYRNVHILYIYIYHIYYIPLLYVCMCPSGIVIHYVGWGQSPNPQEVHCFKWEFWVWFVRFWFAWLFRECNPGVKWELPVLSSVCGVNLDERMLDRILYVVTKVVRLDNHYSLVCHPSYR
jgi:hypothetical protein